MTKNLSILRRSSLWSRIRGYLNAGAVARPELARTRLSVEALEDRVVPTIRFTPLGPFAGGGTQPIAAATGDFNEDGNLDAVVVNYGSNPSTLSLMLGDGTGALVLSGPTINLVGRQAFDVDVADFNKDGNLDVVVALQGTSVADSQVRVLLGNGMGGFPTAVQITTNINRADYVAVGDFNNDTNLDIAATNFGTNSITLIQGDGAGGFTPLPPIASGGVVPYGIEAGDFNGDGNLDVVVANYNNGAGGANNNVTVFLGNGAFGLSPAPGTPVFSNSGTLTVSTGYFNADAILDIAVANYAGGATPNTVGIALGNGDGSFTAATGSPIAVGTAQPWEVAVADYNGDGITDFAVSIRITNPSVRVYQGNGDGTFTMQTTVAPLSEPMNLFPGDFNNDGAPDLVVPNFSGAPAGAYVLLNRGGTRTTLVTSNPTIDCDQPVTFTATVVTTVAGATPPNPTGTVEFFANGVLIGTDALDAAGQATFTTSALTGGTYVITARYAGDTVYHFSLSTGITQTVNFIGTSTSIVSSLNPASTGAPVTFTATVTGGNPVDRAGQSVQFLDGGVVIGVGILDAAGQATFTTSTLAPGAHTITASYLGDLCFLPSSASLVQIINVPPLRIFATGADAGGAPQVNVYDADTQLLRYSFYAYSPGFTGGVRVAVADVNGDGSDDVITGAGPGGLPQINVYDGRTGNLLFAFFAFNVASAGPTGTPSAFGGAGPNVFFTGGVYVAGGDTDGDGYAEMIIGADAGGGPQVEIYNGRTGLRTSSFYAFVPGFTGGVRVATADVDGDGRAEILAGAGAGGGPQVVVMTPAGATLASFFATAPNFLGGVYVSGGDTNGDGIDEVITGVGRGGGPQVTIFTGTGTVLNAFFAFTPATGSFTPGVPGPSTLGPTFSGGVTPPTGTPFSSGFTGGVRVATVDTNGDGRVEILAGAGPGGGPQVVVYDALTLAALNSFFAYPAGFIGGVFVG